MPNKKRVISKKKPLRPRGVESTTLKRAPSAFERARAMELSRIEMAYALGISPDNFTKQYRRFIPDAMVRHTGPGGGGPFYQLKAFGAIMAGAIAEVTDAAAMEQVDAPAKSGTKKGARAMDELRIVRARMTQLEYQIKLGQYVHRDAVIEGFAQLVNVMRRYGEAFRRMGNDQTEVFNEMMEDAAETAERAALELKRKSEQEGGQAW